MKGLFIFVLLPLLIGGCSIDRDTDSTRPTAQSPVEIRVARSRVAPVDERIELIGTLKASERVVVSTQQSGNVAAVEVDLGDAVTQGQVVGSLESEEFQIRAASMRAELQQAVALLERSRQTHRRLSRLFESKVVSAEEFDRAATDLRVAETNREVARTHLALVEKELRDRQLRSPIDGYVSVRHASVGEHLLPNAPFAEVVSVDPLKLRTEVPERFALAVKPGTPVRLEIDSMRGNDFLGEVSRVGPDVDTRSRTFIVESRVPNPKGTLKPGQFARVAIELGSQDAVVAPRAAVEIFGSESHVFVVAQGNRIERRVVVPGRELGADIVIVEGLNASEQLAVSHLDRLTDGTVVKPAAESPG